MDIDPHLSARDNGRLGRAGLPVEQAYLVAVDRDPGAGHDAWPPPLAMLSLGARP